MTITILGRQPAISLAELESLYGAAAIRRVATDIALVDATIRFDRLGGVVKAAEYLATINSVNPQKAFDYARQALPEFVSDFPDGKIKLGVSLYGLAMPLGKQTANTLSLKRVLRDAGRSVRVAPNTEPALSSAQTYHNQLTSALGCELVMIRDGDKTIIGRVTHVQNINEYAERDRNRPRRDSRVGMLPPKLAQTIINLATSTTPTLPSTTLLDPFCGTGVVLQEAGLMGYSVYGSDIDERMIRYTRDNLNWLIERGAAEFDRYYEIADATDHTWRPPVNIVACEGYLGTPFASEPAEPALRNSITTCNLITKKFLRSLHGQLQPGARLCVAVPSWLVRGRTHHLPLLDDIAALGYQRIAFTHADTSDLTYRRDDQIVGRELLVLVHRPTS